MPFARWLRPAALVAALLNAFPSAAAPEQPSDYELWSAKEKEAWFLANLDVGRGGSPDVADWENGPCAENLCHNAEFLRPGGRKTRTDVTKPCGMRVFNTHTIGMAARVKAVWDSSRYTGLFQKSDLGFARWGFSAFTNDMEARMVAKHEYRAGGYQPKPMTDSGFLDCFEYDCYNVTRADVHDDAELEENEKPDYPTYMALKFFRGGVASGSIHTSIGGGLAQPNWNHLAHTYTNLMAAVPGDRPNSSEFGFMSASEMGAQRGTRWPGFTGLADFAMYDQDGHLQRDIMFPYQLLFRPTRQAQDAIPLNCQGTYPDMVKIGNGNLRPGQVLYDILAKHSWDSAPVKIGRLELASQLMTSADTDRQVFFYHTRYERDLILRPDLAEGHGCKDFWSCLVCPWVPDVCDPTPETLNNVERYLRGEIEYCQALPQHCEQQAKSRTRKAPASCRRMRTAAEIEEERRGLRRARTWIDRARRRKARREGVAEPGSPEERAEDDEPMPWEESERPEDRALPEVGERPRAGAAVAAASARAGAGRLRGGGSLGEVRQHRPLQESRGAQEIGKEAMRRDDPGPYTHYDPISDFEHTEGWLCQSKSDEWPAAMRPFPETTDCPRTRVQSRLPSEPEYAVDANTCADLPECSKQDGLWYSLIYPCACGRSTCQSGELCLGARSNCTSWGPFSR